MVLTLKINDEEEDSGDSKLSSKTTMAGFSQSVPTIKQKVNSCKKLYIILMLH